MKNKDGKKKNKRAFVDDGRTVYDMSGLNPDGKKDKEPIGLSRKEKHAGYKGGIVGLRAHFSYRFGVVRTYRRSFMALAEINLPKQKSNIRKLRFLFRFCEKLCNKTA